MRKIIIPTSLILFTLIILLSAQQIMKASNNHNSNNSSSLTTLKLPKPNISGYMTLETTLQLRHSIRNFQNKNLSEQEISQLLWAAQGITRENGFRTAPSAGAIYPIIIYIVLPQGLYYYDLTEHSLQQLSTQDLRDSLAQAALFQDSIKHAPATIILTALFNKTAAKYGDKAIQFVYQESGHIAQNILLQATALNLGGVPIGAYSEQQVQANLKLPANHTPVYLIPVGYKK